MIPLRLEGGPLDGSEFMWINNEPPARVNATTVLWSQSADDARWSHMPGGPVTCYTIDRKYREKAGEVTGAVYVPEGDR